MSLCTKADIPLGTRVRGAKILQKACDRANRDLGHVKMICPVLYPRPVTVRALNLLDGRSLSELRIGERPA